MSNRRLREKAEKAQIQRENPELWTGLRKPGQPSKIFNRKEAEAEYQSNIEAARELARKQAVELDGSAPTGQAAPAPAGQTAPTPAPANSGFTGVAGRNVGFSSNANAGFSGVSGSQVGFNRESPTATPTGAPPRRETFAEEDARTRREKTLSGAFGEKAQAKAENLEGRKGLFAEMKAGGLDSATARKRAEALGVDDKGFNTAVARIEGVDMTPAPTVAGPAAPLTGRALAESNIRTMGQAGAAADYFKRAEAEKAALAQRSPLNTVGSRFADTANRPVPAPSRSFAETFGTEVDRDEPSPAMQQARANTVAAQERATTMRSEYERGKVKEAKSPVSSRPTPITEPTPKVGFVEKTNLAAEKIRNDIQTRMNTPYQERMQEGFVSGKDIAKAAAPVVAAAARFRPSQLPRVALAAAQNRSGDMLASARGFVERTNEASDLFGKNLRKQLGIQ